MSIVALPDPSSATLRQAIDQAAARKDPVLVLSDPRFRVQPAPRAVERLAEVLEDCDAGMVYADASDATRTDYKFGSIRDDFDLGPLIAIAVSRSQEALSSDFATDWRWGGLYDLRLRLSTRAPIVRIPEPLYRATDPDTRGSAERQFDYVGASKREYQVEMEAIATGHLRRTGAFLTPRDARVTDPADRFPLRASIVIPVRDRARTILDAARSALSQIAPFDFNVIVVDNHSRDETHAVLSEINDPRLVVHVPERTDLRIGGCWQEAVELSECGRYALQLDSDDLFSGPDVLARVVERMEGERYAMLVGAYTPVNFDLEPIPPGLVDHREWTPENGHNNALRINGFGAPRAFDVSVVRRLGFPNVSYGEDYAVGLRICREYALGRMYESLYLCRRWEGNTDSAPTRAETNRFNEYKDWIRTAEIHARIRMNRWGRA